MIARVGAARSTAFVAEASLKRSGETLGALLSRDDIDDTGGPVCLELRRRRGQHFDSLDVFRGNGLQIVARRGAGEESGRFAVNEDEDVGVAAQ